MVDVLDEPTAHVLDDARLPEHREGGQAHPSFVTGGQMIGGRYRIDALLATGGMGQVWRGLDLVLGRPVAVKVLRREHTGDSAALSRFRTEARLSAGLAHPNIAALYDYGEVGPAPDGRGERLAYLVMELVEGEALSTLLRRERRLPPGRTLEILQQTAAGLAAAHAAGVVHRDVKPGNLMLGPRGTVTITDFGIAWTESSDPLTQTGQVMGTAQYLSPEQAWGAKAGPASDVYALGMVAYECLAGRRAFEGESPLQIALMHINQTPEPLPADIPDELRHLVERVLEKDPEQRFPDGAALLSAVQDVLAGRPLSTQFDRHGTTVLPIADRRPETEPVAARSRRATSGTSVGPRHAASGRRPSLRILIALLLAGVVAGLFLWSRESSSPADAVAPPGPTAVSAAPVNAVDYRGRPVAEVEAELARLGLAVQLRPIQTADVPDGDVLAVEPAGELSPGQTVTITYAVAPSPAPAPTAAPAVAQGGGAGTGNPGPSTTASETNPAAESSTAPRHGNGNGHGNGRGNG